jgi:hypothetical protein
VPDPEIIPRNPKLLLIVEGRLFFFLFIPFQNSILTPAESWKHKTSLEKKIILSLTDSRENFWHGLSCYEWGLCVWVQRSRWEMQWSQKKGVQRPAAASVVRMSFCFHWSAVRGDGWGHQRQVCTLLSGPVLCPAWARGLPMGGRRAEPQANIVLLILDQ